MHDKTFIQSEDYYNYRYDLNTIIETLDLYTHLRKELANKKDLIKNMSKEKYDIEANKVASYAVNALKAEKFRYRSKTIEEWMTRDKRLQEKYDLAIPPRNIKCNDCGSDVKVFSKDLIDTINDNSQVLFMFKCVKCKKNQGFYEDGTKWVYNPPLCPKCQSPLNHESKDKKDLLVTIYSCINCLYTETDTFDIKKTEKEREEKELWEKNIYKEYKYEFCYDEETGPRAIADFDQLIRFSNELKEKEKQDNDPLVQKARKLTSLKAIQLKDLIQKSIEPHGFTDLQFGKPELGSFIIIDFTVNDINDRNEHESSSNLKKILKETLDNTNWRLMSDGVSYRLGILSGRLKAYEREEDLVSLVS